MLTQMVGLKSETGNGLVEPRHIHTRSRSVASWVCLDWANFGNAFFISLQNSSFEAAKPPSSRWRTRVGEPLRLERLGYRFWPN